jgi:deoxyribonuclease V
MHEIEYEWNLPVADARENQKRLRSGLVVDHLDLSAVRFILNIGVSYSERTKVAFAVAMPSHPNGSPVDETLQYSCSERSEFPYIPGLYAYREGPAICKLINSLPGLPDLIVFDAQGTAHPKGFGLAAHIGVIYNVPTLGLTRKLLIGRSDNVDETDRASAHIRDRSGSQIGVAYRFLGKCEVSFASPGHRTNLHTVQAYCDAITSVRSCFPSALSMVHERANRLAKASRI